MKNNRNASQMLFFLLPTIILAHTINDQIPYYGTDSTQPPQMAKLYPDVPAPGHTPAFTKEGPAFTTQEELLAYIAKLETKSKNLSIRIIGTSQEGLDIPALYFTTEKDISPESFSKKPTIWLQGQIHGNEPAGGEAALVIAERLTGKLGEEVLNKVNIIIVPRVNPDGARAFVRALASGDDGNRDLINLENPEVRAIQAEFSRYLPELAIDAHEYGPDRGRSYLGQLGEEGLVDYYDILMESGRNLNIPEEIRRYSDEEYVKPIRGELKNRGFSSEHYYTSDTSTPEAIKIVEGGGDARIERNSYGLHLAISFLVESRGIGIGRENFPRRVAAHVLVHEHIIRSTAKNAKKVKKLIAEERAKLVKKGLKANDNDQVVVTSKDTLYENVPFLFADLAKGEAVKLPVTYFNSTDAVPTLTRDRPTAYILRPEYALIAEKFKNQGIRGFKLLVEGTLPVEAFKITQKEQGDAFEGGFLTDVKSELVKKYVTFPRGTFVFPTTQPTANLLSVSLEPEAKDGYVMFNYIPSELGEELPVYRFMLDGQKRNKNLSKNGYDIIRRF